MTDSHDIAATPRPARTPRAAKRVAAVGIPVALIAAAAVSFAGLTLLGGFAGIDHPWLMPVAIDVYATTATLIAMLLPEGHPARRTAVWNARLGLAMSMSGNALARSLHLGTRGYTISDALLTFVGAWPSLIVERLLQLQGRLVAGNTPQATTALPSPETVADDPGPATPAEATETPEATGNTAPAATPTPVAQPTTPVARTPAATRPKATSNGAIQLITSAQKEKIVAKLLAEHGDDYSLALIADAIGTPYRATAMKVRDRVIKARSEPQDDAPAGAGEADTEPEPVLGEVS